MDDIVLGDVGEDADGLVEKVTDMLANYVVQSQARRLVFSPKSTIVGTTLALARRVERGFRSRGILEFTAKVAGNSRGALR